ncbi:hypothetical protein K9N08_03580 [Candidatus Gracilibacteria bacterium]|nr:hypothetical protein [Candidatus Gracilibacteria bacterium]MCF7856604.1 hypothetical protein [Candidatus Gracilibacteria bacterium]MCF7896893.1 hypothetical protein [Candidatus Gracilibacteria bacterium]
MHELIVFRCRPEGATLWRGITFCQQKVIKNCPTVQNFCGLLDCVSLYFFAVKKVSQKTAAYLKNLAA